MSVTIPEMTLPFAEKETSTSLYESELQAAVLWYAGLLGQSTAVRTGEMLDLLGVDATVENEALQDEEPPVFR